MSLASLVNAASSEVEEYQRVETGMVVNAAAPAGCHWRLIAAPPPPWTMYTTMSCIPAVRLIAPMVFWTPCPPSLLSTWTPSTYIRLPSSVPVWNCVTPGEVTFSFPDQRTANFSMFVPFTVPTPAGGVTVEVQVKLTVGSTRVAAGVPVKSNAVVLPRTAAVLKYAPVSPFTAVLPEDAHMLDSEPGKVRAKAYDIVLNGMEVGGGSYRIHDSATQAKVFKILGLTEYLERKPKALSGGQRQRVAMGRAIVRSPQVFCMDEPLSNLDASLRVQMRRELLASSVDDMYATVIRQAYFVMFERTAHNAIMDNKSPAELYALYMDNLREQFGDSLEIAPEFQYEWVSIPHIYQTPFYCYAYSFGQLLVLALYRRYQQQGEAFKPGYLKLLAYGGSARPEEILREANIDITDPAFWQGGFDVIRDMIDELAAIKL